MLFPPGLEYISAFFGCLYARAVPVPTYPPRPNRSLERLQAIAKDARPGLVLTTETFLSAIRPRLEKAPDLAALTWKTVEAVGDGGTAVWREPRVDGDTLALLQYTSGSTAMPKGVMVSHRNLLHNEAMIQRAFGQDERSVVVGWLPLFHDMGLIGNVLQPLYLGVHCILLPPLAFLQRPACWLEAISRYRATTSGGPNFAYDLCVRKIRPDQRESLDLSSWTLAFNGAEPVRKETLDRFAATFGPHGFRREAFYPCYGLAEATLFVAGGMKMGGARTAAFERSTLERNHARRVPDSGANARDLVSCGSAWLEQRIRIVDPESALACAPGRVGEIWVAGPSVAQGYWDRPEESQHTFQARLAGTGEGPYLRTGDLGFIADDELFITGRLKDLLIIRGRNHYPQDIERTVERCHPDLRPGEGAAFSVDIDGEERLVIVQEVTRRPGEHGLAGVVEAIRQAVAEEHEIQLHAVALLRPGRILKTSSGKVQRRAMRQAFLDAALDTVLLWQVGAAVPAGDVAAPAAATRRDRVEQWLAAQVAIRLGFARAEVDFAQPLGRYGLDSLAGIELLHALEEEHGVSLPVSTLLQDVSIAELAEQVAAQPAVPAPQQEQPAAATPREIPLSRGQQALWFLHRLAPESAAYNVAGAARVRGPLDVAALRRSFQALVERHDLLRVRFEPRGGAPVQTVQEGFELSFHLEDAAGWPDARLAGRLGEEAHRPFDLATGPVLRLHCWRRGEEHLLLLAAHHAVLDLWSLAVLVRELGEIYAAETTGAGASLPPLSVGYGDYVRWQEEMLAGERGARLWEFWRRQLAGDLPLLDLATDRPRPPVQTFGGATQSLRLDRRTAEGLALLAFRNGATLFTVLLAAYQAFLYRRTGQQEVLIGSPTTGRAHSRFAPLVGYFVNPVAIRLSAAGEPAFRQLLAGARTAALAALEHQDLPFALLVDRLQPERDTSRSALFQTLLVLQQVPAFGHPEFAAFALGEEGGRCEVGPLTLESVRLEQRVAQFDLTLAAALLGGGLAISLQYSTDLFEAATARRMLVHFETLLVGVLADPERPVSELPLLSEAERHQLATDFNDTARDYPSGSCLHHLFERQATRTPDATSVVDRELCLTYHELASRAERLARHLRGLGVGPEVPVGVLMERGADLIVAVLGVLAAGGAYAPLDPSYPEERLAYMLDNARVGIVVCDRPAAWVAGGGRRTIVLPESWAGEEAGPAVAAPSGGQERQLAYLIYTSGSTGRPKAVAIEHRSAVTLVRWAQETFSPSELAGVLFATSICFDLSVFELFVPLSVGGTVVVAGDALELPSLPRANGVTLLNTVPSVLRELLRRGPLPASVSAVSLAGEPLSRDLATQAYAQPGVRRLFNLYGPSEDTTYSTASRVERSGAEPPAIGRPITATTAYVVAGQKLQGLGVPGELLLGGEGVARGYLHRAERTAERFVPDPFGNRPGVRLYRTGDLSRWRVDGELEFLGRLDHQVKVRGFRIELGEVESVLSSHPSVGEAVVVAQQDRTGDPRLVAYVTAAAGRAPSPAELREHLRRRLPHYMIPQAFATLAALPLTRNGKVDRRALPSLAQQGPDAGQEFAAPRTPVEQAVAAIWSEVLGLDRVGAIQDFFALGGHSLHTAQVVSRLSNAFQVDLPLRSLFEMRTVRALAAAVEEALRSQRGASQPTAEGAARDGGRPLWSFAQEVRGSSGERAQTAAIQEDREIIAPRTPAEEVVAGIWAEVLGLDRVGATEDFFALGGHSLKATRAVSLLSDAFQVDLSPRLQLEARTVQALAAAVEEAVRSGGGAPRPAVARAVREQGLPLSFAQERLWFLHRLHPESAAYNMACAARLEGRLDLAALACALDEIVRRHEALRTTFVEAGGVPLQVVEPARPVALPVADLRDLAEGAREGAARWLLREQGRRPFDLARGPLLRAALLRLDEERHILFVSMHHVISDGWSLGVFLRELAAHYRAFAAGDPAPLPELALQYADHAVWQRHWLEGEALAPQIAYWRRRLAGAPVLLDLPTDRPRLLERSSCGSSLPFALPPAPAAELAGLGRRQGATPFMTLLAGFQALLSRISGQLDVTVGTPVANRSRTEIEPLIGCFVNTLAMRTDLTGDPSFEGLLGRVRETALEAYANQDVPFERLVGELGVARGLGRTPLFQVMLALQTVPLRPLDLGGVELRPEEVDTGTAKFDLTLYLSEGEDGIAGRWEYSTDLFEAATVERMAGHFLGLLEAAAGEPGRRFSELPLLTSAERLHLLTWNATARFYPQGPQGSPGLLHGLFEAQVERTPAAVAVSFEGATLTYAELEEHSNRLAHHLRSLGVGPEVVVGLCAERSLEMVVALLGILKAGGAYLPLDPGYPRDRLGFMLEDARVPVLLAQERVLTCLPAHGARLVRLDADREEIERRPAARPEPLNGPRDLAYVIFTSGSTGRPKGVMNAHEGIVNRLLWMQERCGGTGADRVLQKTSFSFDVSVWELFWPLAVGARLVMAAPGGHQDSAYLARTIVEEGITTIHFVPSMLRAFLEDPGVARCTGLARVICSGEALPFELQQRFFSRLGAAGCELHNLYGPTEAAVEVTSWRCERQAVRPPVPIGRPVANTRIHLLDADGNEVPVGVPGELHIGGVQVGRGYLRRPGLTAEKFVPDPFAGQAGTRLYRTGDLARRLPGGEVDYLGRLDHQVKVRGFRIELGEIEAALLELPGIEQAVVTARDDLGTRRLAAYVVGEAAADAQALCALLRDRLPEYMVPADFVPLAALPLAANGKVDRKALPAPERQDCQVPCALLHTREERLLAGIWEQVLRREAIGRDDNFFQLGGDSILGIQVIARAGRAGLRLTPQLLFQHQTIAELVRAAGAAEASAAGGGELAGTIPAPRAPLPAQARRTRGPLPLDGERPDETGGPAVVQTVWLEAEETRSLLEEVPRAYRTTTDEVLLTALVHAFCEWTGVPSLRVDLQRLVPPGPGEEDLCPSRAAGRRAAMIPVVLHLAGARGPGEHLKAVKEQMHRLSGGGIGHGPPGDLSPDAQAAPAIEALPPAEVTFRGPDLASAAVAEPSRWLPPLAGMEPGGPDRYRVEVACEVAEGRLRVAWTCGRALRGATVEKLANGFLEALRGLMAHCLEPGAGGYTPSDFPRIEIGQRELDALVAARRGEPGRDDLEDIYPPTPLQQGMLFHVLEAPGVYLNQQSLSLEGILDEAALRAAFERVVDRHQALRTAFVPATHGRVLQVVYRRAELPLEQLDWRGLELDEQSRRLTELLRADRRRGFELSREPLMRLILVRLADDRYQLVWSFHLILLDAWSTSLILREVLAFYDALRRGRELELEPATCFGSYIEWLRRRDLSAAEAYWRRTLHGAAVPTLLGEDRTAAGAPDPEVDYREGELRLAEADTAALRAFAGRHRLTLNTLVQGAWALHLSHRSGADDVVFGSVVSGRPADFPGVESTVGLFLNTLPVRARVALEAPLLSWLAALQAQQAEARRFEQSPLAAVQRWSGVAAGKVLFESVVIFQNVPVDLSLADPERNLRLLGVSSTERNSYPLTLVAVPDSRLWLKLVYDRRRFLDSTVARTLAKLSRLLIEMASRPEESLAAFAPDTGFERRQLITHFNQSLE